MRTRINWRNRTDVSSDLRTSFAQEYEAIYSLIQQIRDELSILRGATVSSPRTVTVRIGASARSQVIRFGFDVPVSRGQNTISFEQGGFLSNAYALNISGIYVSATEIAGWNKVSKSSDSFVIHCDRAGTLDYQASQGGIS